MGKRFAILGLLFGAAIFGSSSRAQTPQGQGIEQARLRTNDVRSDFRQKPLDIGINMDGSPVVTPGDLDLGIQAILKRREQEQYFRLFGDAAGFYTNNVALTKNNPQADSYFFADVGLTYQRMVNENLQVEATIRQALFRYNTYSQFDFESFNAGTGVSYVVKQAWDIMLSARYNYERMTSGDIGSAFFSNNTITVGAQKTFPFANGNYAFAGAAAIFGFSSPLSSQRDEYGLFGGGHYNFTRKFTGDVYYRIASYCYTEGGRTDLNQTAVFSLAYLFNDYARVTASVSLTSDRSNQSVYDYSVINAGGGLSFQYRF